MGSKDTVSRRLGERSAMSKRARVHDEAGHSVEVVIKDLSTNGARLAVAPNAAVPQRFKIRFDDYEACGEVVWRDGGQIGVRFILPGEDDGRVRPSSQIELTKTPLVDLRAMTRRRRRLFGLLPG